MICPFSNASGTIGISCSSVWYKPITFSPLRAAAIAEETASPA